MQLTLFEREVSKESLHGKLRSSIGALLKHVRGVFDIVLIDCPPGLSVLTESWLREADFHLSPTKPDYVSTCGLEVFRRFKGLNPEMGFAENLGVIVNMKDAYSSVDADYQRWLMENPDNLCFAQAVPRTSALQVAAQLSPVERSYVAKYPGDSGVTIRAVAEELINRLTGANRAAQAKPQPATAKATPAQAPSLPKVAEPAPAAQKAAPRRGRPAARSPATDAGTTGRSRAGGASRCGGQYGAARAGLPGGASPPHHSARRARRCPASEGGHAAAAAAKQADPDQIRRSRPRTGFDSGAGRRVAMLPGAPCRHAPAGWRWRRCAAR
jgi:hypothetical protein